MAASSSWVELLKNSQKTCMIQDGRRKIHFTLQDGRELSEEYNVETNELVVRKWKKKSTLGGAGSWEYEVGEQLAPKNVEVEGIMESNTNPIFVRKDTARSFQWRVRNIPYCVDNYIVTCEDGQHIIIRTLNNKYYKKFRIPDMDRCNLKLQQTKLLFAHANNTLIVTYMKPPVILEMEKTLQAEFSKLKASKDGDVDCTPS